MIEGDEVAGDTLQATSRIYNYCQLMDYVVVVTSTQEAVSKAGRSSEKEYQAQKAMKHLKNSIEATILNNQAYSAGTDTSARQMAGFAAYVTTATSFDASGTTAGADNNSTAGANARTDGSSTRQFTEDLLLDAHQACYAAGGNPSLLVVGPYNARKVAGFSGGTTKVDRSEDKKLYNVVDVYIDPFGTLSVVTDRFSRARDAWLIDPDYAKLAYLQPFKTEPIAKIGHADRTMISVELTLEVGNEAAHAGVFDLASS